MHRNAWTSGLTVACLMAAASLLSVRQARADYEPRTYKEPGTGRVLDYNLYVPDDYNPAKKYPILVFLHAAGDDSDLPRKRSKGWTTSFTDGSDKQDHPSFFLIPVSQTNSSGWGDGLSDAVKFEGLLTVVLLKELLASGEYNIDADRLYVTGPSMGGRGTWDMIEKNPGLFAAAVPIASPGLDDAHKVVGENIWAVNGERDSTVSNNRKTIDAIRAAGGNPIYTELANHGHDTWRSIYNTDEFMDWVYAQRRGVPWWTVSTVPSPIPSDDLTEGIVVVSGPTGPSDSGGGGGAVGVGGMSAGGSAVGVGGAAGTAGSAGQTSGSGGVPPMSEGGRAMGAAATGGALAAGGTSTGGAALTPGGSSSGTATDDTDRNAAESGGCRYAPSHRGAPGLLLLGLAAASLLRRRAP